MVSVHRSEASSPDRPYSTIALLLVTAFNLISTSAAPTCNLNQPRRRAGGKPGFWVFPQNGNPPGRGGVPGGVPARPKPPPGGRPPPRDAPWNPGGRARH